MLFIFRSDDVLVIYELYSTVSPSTLAEQELTQLRRLLLLTSLDNEDF